MNITDRDYAILNLSADECRLLTDADVSAIVVRRLRLARVRPHPERRPRARAGRALMSRPEAGTRVRLIAMPDDPDPIPHGSEGTVIGGSDGFGPSSQQVWCLWDNGRSLNLIPGIDVFEVIS